MRLHRLRVENFAGIHRAEVPFGAGLNVLYGPNDLGKSTLADAIRLVLLLPHTSTWGEPYVSWKGGADPVVELVFETDDQRLWRVRKQFGKSGSSLLQESRNGIDWDDVERARKVDGRLREILRWGIPEPGGAGGGKGLPSSFLATVLLSTQGSVGDLLGQSLEDDGITSGRDRIATALQAVAQDPLFVSLLNETQARRDEAYTDKGAKKTAKGSVFKAAADRLREVRESKEELEKLVADSASVESDLRALVLKRGTIEDERNRARLRLDTLQLIGQQAADRGPAMDQVRAAEAEVARIERLGTDTDQARQEVGLLEIRVAEAEAAVRAGEAALEAAEQAHAAAEVLARGTGADPALAYTVRRQQLALRAAAAEASHKDAARLLATIEAAETLVAEVGREEREHLVQMEKVGAAEKAYAAAAATLAAADVEIERCDVLGRALEARAARDVRDRARAELAEQRAAQAAIDTLVREHGDLSAKRSAIVVPAAAELAPMRKLANTLASARGALDVGLVVTVTPNAPVDLRVSRDGVDGPDTRTDGPVEIEASSEVLVAIGTLATVRVRGGRREAQERVAALEEQWGREVVPHLLSAGATDLEGLDARIALAAELTASIRSLDQQIFAHRGRVRSLAGAEDRLATAELAAVVALEAAGGAGDPEGDPASLKRLRIEAGRRQEAARVAANQAENAVTLERERSARLGLRIEERIGARSACLAAFPDGLPTARASAAATLAADGQERTAVAAELAATEAAAAVRQREVDGAVGAALAAVQRARTTLGAARATLGARTGEHQFGVLELQRLTALRDGADAERARTTLEAARHRLAGLPVPERGVSAPELADATNTLSDLTARLANADADIQLTRGRLMQVGGRVAKERLRDVVEAFEAAEQDEKEIEAEYDAWCLLLAQMKEADAAQASNLGQALAPGISGTFRALTDQRYDSVRLTAQLATDGVVVGGLPRDPERLSVGTREQLSTLYRLSLAEYLGSTLVLDDQLVQSDDHRLGWFRSLLADKAKQFQILVFTCRPTDYLPSHVPLPADGPEYTDNAEGTARTVDLGRAVHRR